MRIEFEFDTELGVFRDALHFEDGAVPSEAEIEAMKIARRDGWIAAVNAASQSTESSAEE